MTFALLGLALIAAPVEKTWTFTAGDAPRVKAVNLNGRIEVTAASGSPVEVKASGADAGELRVEALHEGEEVRVTVCCGEGCGEKRQSNRGDECKKGRIDLRLAVPAAAEVVATNVSGHIRVSGVEGAQVLTNVSGTTGSSGSAGALKITTVSGRVELAPRKLAPTQINTVSGRVGLKLPADASATVRLNGVSGRILGAVGEGDGRTRVIGGGEVEVRANVVSGSLELKQ